MNTSPLGWVAFAAILSMGLIACSNSLQSTSGKKTAASKTYAVTVTCAGEGSQSAKGLISDSGVKSVWIQINDDSKGISVGSGTLTNYTTYWGGSIDIDSTGNLTFQASAYNSSNITGTKLYYGAKKQTVYGSGDHVSIDVAALYVAYPNTAPVSVTTTDSMVPAGQTMTVDASALAGANTLAWNGSNETDGSFSIKAGSSAATITGGDGDDTFDFTASGVVFSSADKVNGGEGSDSLKIGAATTTNALDHVYSVESLSFADQAPVSITTVDDLATGGLTLTVDASALTGTHAFTWDGSGETDSSFYIKSGSSAATITGGYGNDTIVCGSGAATIDGGTGNDTITLGSGADTVVFSSLNGADSISGFDPSADTLSLKASTAGFVTLAGTAVTSSTSPSYNVFAGVLTGNSGSPVALSILANRIASSSALVSSLATGGTNALTLASAASAGKYILVLYSDGSNAHLAAVRLNTSATTFSASDLTVVGMATLTGISSLVSWSFVQFSIE